MNHSTNTAILPVARRVLSFVLALVAGLITWAFVHTHHPTFDVAEEYHIRGIGESDERWSAFNAQQLRVDYQNAALVVGILGGTLAIALAASRPQRISLLAELLPGVTLAVLVGVLAGLAGCWVQRHYAGSGQVSVVESAYINATMYGILGMGLGGILASFNSWNWAVVDRAIVGLIQGMVAGTVYVLLASLLLTAIDLDAFIPHTTLGRLLWLGIGSGILGLSLPAGKSKPKAEKPVESKAA